MAASLNQVLLAGNVGADLEVKKVNGKSVAKLRLATTERWTDKASGEKKEETQWHNVEAWGQQAEFAAKYLAKGRSVLVEGAIKYRTSTKGEVKSYFTDIVARRIQSLDRSGPNDDDAADDASRGAATWASRPPSRKNLRQFRVARWITQEELAQQAQVSVSYVSMLENARRIPPLPRIEQLAEALGITAVPLLQDAKETR